VSSVSSSKSSCMGGGSERLLGPTVVMKDGIIFKATPVVSAGPGHYNPLEQSMLHKSHNVRMTHSARKAGRSPSSPSSPPSKRTTPRSTPSKSARSTPSSAARSPATATAAAGGATIQGAGSGSEQVSSSALATPPMDSLDSAIDSNVSATDGTVDA
jgi:hypothetical protein